MQHNPLLRVQRLRHLLLRRLLLVRLQLRRRELPRAPLLLARLRVRPLPLIQHRKQHRQRQNRELRLRGRHRQLVRCGPVYLQPLGRHLLHLRDSQRLAPLRGRRAHRWLIVRLQRQAPIDRPAERPRVNDLQEVLALLRELAKVGRRRVFDPRLRVKPVPAALRDKDVPAHRVPVDRHHVFHNARVAAAEDALGKVPSGPKDPAQAFRKPSQANLCMRANLLHRVDVRSLRSDMRKGSANFIQYDLAQGRVRDVRRRSSRSRRFNANHAQLR